jgi:hypothetical protein
MHLSIIDSFNVELSGKIQIIFNLLLNLMYLNIIVINLKI